MEDQHKESEHHINTTDITKYFGRLLMDFIDLSKGVDKWNTIKEIKSKQSMSGANAWMLMCSIIIVSIGLNLNSQAVIIGAMLISPLMSPILGVGLAVGINDKDALRQALLHFGAAILIAIVFSTLYFLLTPLDIFTEQMGARTEPTFLDVLIGLFGGIAGIISIARKDISTTLPGVAIATALMPPLCVSGYGLAHGYWDVAIRSFYLFFLNSFFVAFATWMIVRYLKFPYKEYESPKDRRKNIRYVFLFSVIMIVPSFIIFSNVFEEAQMEKKLNNFINTYVGDKYIYLDDYELLHLDDDTYRLVMKVYGDSINREMIPELERGLELENITNTTIEIIPTSEINLDKVRNLENQLLEVGEQINSKIVRLENERRQKDEIITNLKERTNFLKQDSVMFDRISRDLKIFFPDIQSVRLAVSQYSDFKDLDDKVPLAVVDWSRPSEAELEKCRQFIMKSYNLDTLVMIIQ